MRRLSFLAIALTALVLSACADVTAPTPSSDCEWQGSSTRCD
jgi:hypothetical protein